MGSDPLRARCDACGKAVVLNAKGLFPRHQMKGGAFCRNVGTKAPTFDKIAKPATRQQSRAASKGQKVRSSKRRVRVIRLGRGPMGAEAPSRGTDATAAGEGFWRPGRDWHAQRPGENDGLQP